MIKILIKLIKSFFRNFEKVDDSYFENNFNLFKRAKSHVWTHVTMYLAWTAMLALSIFLSESEPYMEAIAILFLVCIISYPLSITLFIIENTFFPKYKLKRRFIYENPLFSIIWLIGQIFVIFITSWYSYHLNIIVFK